MFCFKGVKTNIQTTGIKSGLTTPEVEELSKCIDFSKDSLAEKNKELEKDIKKILEEMSKK